MFRRLSRSSKNWSCRLDEEGGQSIGDECKSSNYSVERRPDTGSGGGFRSVSDAYGAERVWEGDTCGVGGSSSLWIRLDF